MARTASIATRPEPMAIAWSSSDRPSRTEPSAARAISVSASGSASAPSSPTILAKCAESSGTSTRRRSKRCVRDSTVTGTLRTSVVAKMNFTCAGGSSSVFSSALKGALGEHVNFVDQVDLVRATIGLYRALSMISRMLSTPVLEAASISSTSGCRPP